MRHRVAVRVITALALVATSLFAGAPAWAAEPGFAVNIGQAPASFTTGKAARTLTAVASTDRGRRCLKVRWSLEITTDGVSLDQIRIARIENGGTFEVRAEADADAVRVVDAEPDPGELCRGRTVTGRWDIGFTGPDNGTVSLEASAVDGDGRVLNTGGVTSRVVSGVAATPSPTPSETEPTEEPTDEATEDPGDETPTDDTTSTPAVAIRPTAGTPSVLGPGLIIGAVLVFLGVGLLLRMRTRNRQSAAWEAESPTGFYQMPR
ncbi:MAG TPA: hypothetical protein VGB74_08875 [Actinoplanes sp.]